MIQLLLINYLFHLRYCVIANSHNNASIGILFYKLKKETDKKETGSEKL